MQWYRGPEGDQRIWYEPEDIERIAEDELKRANLVPSLSEPVTDLERFIEGYLKADLDQYADLPDDVLGRTEFQAGKQPVVSISSKLTESAEADIPSPGAVGRWRATMAHEGSHILLHRYLFDSEMAQLVRGQTDGTQVQRAGLMRCLHRDITPVSAQEWSQIRRHKDWREIQANRGMAALLMPGRLFKLIAFQQMTNLSLGAVPTGSVAADTLTAAMAEIFHVSKQAAAIRLESLQVISPQ
jgi:IrrE N-terminal-like domain